MNPNITCNVESETKFKEYLLSKAHIAMILAAMEEHNSENINYFLTAPFERVLSMFYLNQPSLHSFTEANIIS